MHRQLIALCVLALASASPAWGARVLVDGFEYDGATPSTKAYGVTGTPDIEAASVTATGVTGDDWSVELDQAGASGNNEYLEWTLTATQEASQQARIRVNTCPGSERTLPLGFGASTNKHCFATVGPDCRVRVYYGDTGNECSQSDNDGTPCTSTAECDPISGESTPSYVCSAAVFGKSSALSLGTWHEVLLTQDLSQTNEGDVGCGLWVDGVNKGSAIRPQGACSGGTDAGDACSVDADCTGGGNCVFSAPSSTWARLGAYDGVSATFDLNVTHWLVDGGAVDTDLAVARVMDLHPSADGGESGCVDQSGCAGTGNHYQCVDDTAGTSAPDDNTTYVQCQGTNRDRWELGNASLGGGETIQTDAGVALSCSLRETTDNTDAKVVKLCARDVATNENCGATFDVNGYGTTFFQSPPAVFTTDPADGAWAQADLDALRLVIEHTGADAAANRARVTDCLAQVEVTGVAPVLPTGLEDVNGDTEITVCIAGDSTCDGTGLYDNLTAQLEQVDNLYDACKGGATIGDFVDNIGGILDGDGTAEFPINVVVGTASAPCDYLFFGMVGNNDFVCMPTCPLHGLCFGGANDGGECQLPLGYVGRKSVGSTELASQSAYCREGANALQACTLAVDCCPNWQSGDGTLTGICRLAQQVACDGTTTCAGATGPCKLCAGVPITVNAGNCSITSGAVGSWCHWGKLNSPECPSGLCVRRTEMAYVQGAFRQVVDAALARGGSSEVRVILLANHMPQETTSDAGFGCRWRDVRNDVGALNRYQRTLATEYGLNVIDMRGAFHARSNENVSPPVGTNADRMIRFQGLTDGIHPSEPTPATGTCAGGGACGVDVMADEIEQCAEATPGTHHSCPFMLATPTATP